MHADLLKKCGSSSTNINSYCIPKREQIRQVLCYSISISGSR